MVVPPVLVINLLVDLFDTTIVVVVGAVPEAEVG